MGLNCINVRIYIYIYIYPSTGLFLLAVFCGSREMLGYKVSLDDKYWDHRYHFTDETFLVLY